MIDATGTCSGIENYSRFLSGRKQGEPPPTLFEYFQIIQLYLLMKVMLPFHN